VLQWFGGEATVPDLIRRKKYKAAEQLLRKQFAAGRRDAELRQQLADVIALDGRKDEAATIYVSLADELARGGHAARAIVVLKKLEQVAPGRKDVAQKLAALIGDRGAEAASVPAPVPVPAPVSEPSSEPEPDALPFAATEPAAEPREALDLGDPPPAVSPDEPLVFDGLAPVAVGPPLAAEERAGLDPALSSPLFGDFSREDLLHVFQALRFRAFNPGDVIVGDGEPGDSLFVISSGRVKAFVKGAGGRYARARELGEGEFFGEIALLHGRPRTATVTAAAPCELLELDRPTVEGLAATRPRVREVLQAFCERRIGV
jgi:hypothetical protein